MTTDEAHTTQDGTPAPPQTPTTQQAQAQPPQTDGQPGPPQTDGQPGPVSYERFKKVNERLKSLETAEAQRIADAKAASDAQLAEQQKWQELAESREKELKAERITNTRQRIAMLKGVPAELIDRLQGGTEEEIAADADRLMQYIKPSTGPGVPPANRGGSTAPTDISKMTPSEIRKLAHPA